MTKINIQQPSEFAGKIFIEIVECPLKNRGMILLSGWSSTDREDHPAATSEEQTKLTTVYFMVIYGDSW